MEGQDVAGLVAGFRERRRRRVDPGALVADRAGVEVDAPVFVPDREVAVEERALARDRVRPEEGVDGAAERGLPLTVGAVDHVNAGGEVLAPSPRARGRRGGPRGARGYGGRSCPWGVGVALGHVRAGGRCGPRCGEWLGCVSLVLAEEPVEEEESLLDEQRGGFGSGPPSDPASPRRRGAKACALATAPRVRVAYATTSRASPASRSSTSWATARPDLSAGRCRQVIGRPSFDRDAADDARRSPAGNGCAASSAASPASEP